ncbi:hypothetical protein [Agromyces humi]|uniref:hypothetical protein n=1 Tax=Agromyces humi TaxID=1766800 RepID=UPI001358F0F4|nr:hypothetical protein [Agromyces humi]
MRYRRPRRSLIITGVLLVVTAGGAITWNTLQPSAEEVEQSRITAVNAADDWASLPRDAAGVPIGEPAISTELPVGGAEEVRFATDWLPPARVGAGVKIVDTTDVTLPTMQLLLADQGAQTPGESNVESDPCLADWGKSKLATSDGVSGTVVEEACGRQAIVTVGGYSVGPRDLHTRTFLSSTTEAAAMVAAVSGTGKFGYASVATDDARAVVVVLAAAVPTAE